MNKVAYNDCYGGFGLSKRAIQWLGSHGIYDKYPGLEDLEKLPRHEPLLIQCIEELGNAVNEIDTVNNIRVKEVYDTGYYITNHDGWERIITPSQMINFDDPLTVTDDESIGVTDDEPIEKCYEYEYITGEDRHVDCLGSVIISPMPIAERVITPN